MLGELCLRRSDMVEAPTGFSKSPGKLEALGWQLMELAARMGSVDAVERMTAVGNTIRCN